MKERMVPMALVVGTVTTVAVMLAAGLLPLWPFEDAPPRWWGGLQWGLWIYVALFALLGVLGGCLRRSAWRGCGRGMLRMLWWIRLWHGWVTLVGLVGAVLGLVFFPLGGWVFGVDLPLSQILLAGLRDGTFYALIWAPGISLVLCFMLAYERTKAAAANVTESSKTAT